MKLYSTLDKNIVDIIPIRDGNISIYSCGPTVYYRMQVGNIRAYVNWDILHRALVYLGYEVKRVVNITDVGHMTSDEDFGDDKMDLQATKEGKNPLQIANEYIDTVLDDFRKMNILAPNGELISDSATFKDVESYGFSRATEYIQEMINIIKKIEENGYTYETDQALYFDVTKVPDYTVFTGQSLEDKNVGVREEVDVDSEKRNPADFVLWMKRVGKYKNHIMNWESPWGSGFPGWHIECTAMGTTILGEKFDIHTGGIDHMSVHHPNERAQNIGAFGHPVVNYWIHNEWVVNKDESKLSKSKGNSFDLPSVIEMGFDPLDLRYLFLSVNYRTRMQFSVESLEGARNARLGMLDKIKSLGKEVGSVLENYKEDFKDSLENNLNMSNAIALVNDLLKSDNPKEDILATILDFDKVLGLDLDKAFEVEDVNYSKEVEDLLERREEARKSKDYLESDRLRGELEKSGYIVLDTPEGQVLKKS